MDYAEELKIHQVLVALIVWVNNFQAPKIQAAFLVMVMILQVVVIGVVSGGWRVGLI